MFEWNEGRIVYGLPEERARVGGSFTCINEDVLHSAVYGEP
jgi:hypothetical protein